MIAKLTALHGRLFNLAEAKLDGWFLGLLARFVFAAVLLTYYLNSAATKVGEGITGFFTIGDNAYFQILPSVVESYGYDATQVPLHWDLVVIVGTYAEFVLPLLIVLGLFTRLAALGMIGFTLVQSYVDIAFHAVDAKTIGAWFDRFPDAAIMDQRTLWILLLIYLAVKGAGALSFDYLLSRFALPTRSTHAKAA